MKFISQPSPCSLLRLLRTGPASRAGGRHLSSDSQVVSSEPPPKNSLVPLARSLSGIRWQANKAISTRDRQQKAISTFSLVSVTFYGQEDLWKLPPSIPSVAAARERERPGRERERRPGRKRRPRPSSFFPAVPLRPTVLRGASHVFGEPSDDHHEHPTQRALALCAPQALEVRQGRRCG